jgi:hypothetical protein
MTTVPAHYREVLYWKLSGSAWRLIVANVLGLLLAGLCGAGFGWFARQVGRLPPIVVGAPELVALLAGLILSVVLHELVHGLVMQAYGAQPRYGVLWRMLAFYATAPGQAFKRDHYLVIGLAPMIGLSLLALLGMWVLAGSPWVGLLAACATLNAAGSIGDLWIVAVVLRYPPHAYVVDERDGMRIFLPAGTT